MPLQGYPSSLSAGANVREPILEGYVFNSGIHDIEHSDVLTYKFDQYYLTTMMDRLGPSEPVAENVYSWNILDRTRRSGIIRVTDGLVAGGSGNTTATIIVDKQSGVDGAIDDNDGDYSATNLGYFIVGDVIRFDMGDLAKVTATRAASTGAATDQEIDIVKIGSGNWTVALSATSGSQSVFGHAFNAFEEASSAPNGRLYLPDEDYNYLQIFRRSFSISGSEFTNRTLLNGGKAWYFEKEGIELKEFRKDQEVALMFGERSSSGTTTTTGGVHPKVLSEGVVSGFASAAGVTETDMQDMIKLLMVEGASKELTVLCGAQFFTDAQRALRDYAVNGGIAYGSFGNNMAGLDFQRYKFGPMTINLAYYELFDDPAVLPFSGTPDANKIDFSNYSIWLDFGSNGDRNIKMCHKELNGVSRKFIHKYVNGMQDMSGSTVGEAANGDDKFQVNLLSHVGVKQLHANRCGILKATS